MNNLTIQQIIKAIPMDSTRREEILTGYEAMSDNDKFAITKISWDAFIDIQNVFEAYWREKIMREVSEGKRHVDGDMAQVVRAEVWREIEERMSGKVEDDARLNDVRSQLEKMIESK